MFEDIVVIGSSLMSSKYRTAWELKVGNVIYMGAMGVQSISLSIDFSPEGEELFEKVDFRRYINSYIYVRIPEVVATKSIDLYDNVQDTHVNFTRQVTLPTKKQLMIYKVKDGREKRILPGTRNDGTRTCVIHDIVDCDNFDKICAYELWLMNHPRGS